MIHITDLTLDAWSMIVVHLNLPCFLMLTMTCKTINGFRDLKYMYAKYMLQFEIGYYKAKQFQISEYLLDDINKFVNTKLPYHVSLCDHNSKFHTDQQRRSIIELHRKYFITHCIEKRDTNERIKLLKISWEHDELLFKIEYIDGCMGCVVNDRYICRRDPCAYYMKHTIIPILNVNGNISHMISHINEARLMPQYIEFINNECFIILYEHYYNIWIHNIPEHLKPNNPPQHEINKSSIPRYQIDRSNQDGGPCTTCCVL